MNSKEEFTVQMKRKVAEIEEILKEYLPKPEGYQKVIMEAMEYSLMAGGKRLRPMLMRETSRLFGDETEALCPFMAALEMIHTYSLVHDDLPAMDNDEYRRGRKTTHIVYGEDMGILAGDALLNYAFETAFRAFETAPQESLKIGRALSVLGRKAGVYGMIGGQVIDVKETGHAVPKDVLDTIYELKTGALIECAMMIGAILGGAEEEDVRKVEKIAHYVGIAFQIQDDILDIEELACGLLSGVRAIYPQRLMERYKLDEQVLALPPYDLLQAIGAKRGMLISGGEVDTERAAKMLVGEFRASKWGRISLERPPQRAEVTDWEGDDADEDEQ